MQKITGYNLVYSISQLPRNRDYNYINPKTAGLIRILDVQLPQGPITFRRWLPLKGETYNISINESISSEMIWRYANAFSEGVPVNIDRVMAGSYNTRSVLETLVAHTPQFYFCYPGRIFDIAGNTTIEHGHKHLLWKPDQPHENASVFHIESKLAISEIPVASAVYDSISLPSSWSAPGIDIDILRRHAQIQIALYLIGNQFSYRTWIAQNDRGLIYNGTTLAELPGIVSSLTEENLVNPYTGAAAAGAFIDCIWFQGSRMMPAIMEVEHTTGVTSGLTRMLNFSEKIPPLLTRYVIVAPDDSREHVINEINKSIFRPINARFFPYSAVEELYAICQRRKLRGVSDEFLDCYIEKVCQNTI